MTAALMASVNCSMKRSSTRAPVATSSTSTASAGLWLMPPLQRTNSMPIGAMSMIAMPSWPAPDGRRRTAMPSASMARATCSCSRTSQARYALPTTARPRFRRRAPARWRRSACATSAMRVGALRVGGRAQVDGEAHASRDHVHRAGQRLDAPHRARRRRAHRAQRLRPRGCIRPPQRARRAAGAIGTVPACPATPVTSMAKR